MHKLVTDENNRILTVDGEGKPHITQVLADLGLSKSFEGVADLEWYATRGKAAHAACRLINEGCLDEKSVAEEIKGYVFAYQQFIKEKPITVIGSEIPLYSELHDFCGTSDLVCFVENQRSVIEIKTTSNIDPAVEIQVGAQAILWDENNQTKQIEKRYVLQLKADGTYRLKDLTHVPPYLFLDALKVWRWKQTHKRTNAQKHKSMSAEIETCKEIAK